MVNPMKTFGLAGLAALAVMATIGASTAMATGSTALCKVHEDPCKAANLVSQVHATSSNFVILNSLANILCLEVLSNLKALGLGNPLSMHSEVLEFNGCGTNANHDNCEIFTEELPLLNVLRTSLNLAAATFQSGVIRVLCDLGLIEIDCKLKLAGTALVMWGSGHLLDGLNGDGGQGGSGKPSGPDEDGFLCPNEIETDILLTALDHFYIVS